MTNSVKGKPLKGRRQISGIRVCTGNSCLQRVCRRKFYDDEIFHIGLGYRYMTIHLSRHTELHITKTELSYVQILKNQPSYQEVSGWIVDCDQKISLHYK